MKIGNIVFESHNITVNNTELCILTAGDAEAKPVVCVHGFPDTPDSFIHQFPVLIENGYRVVVPYLRGYPPSQTGSGVDYAPMNLAHDLIAVIDAFCDGKAYVLGHDWGAIASYLATQLAPEKFERLCTVAVPPFKVFESSMGDVKQGWRSRYAMLFQLGPIAAWWMRKNNCQGLDWLWGYWSPSWQYSEDDIEPLKQCLGSKEAMHSATAYYRAMFKAAIVDKAFMQTAMGVIAVQTCVFQGENDGCIGGVFFKDLSPCFNGDWNHHVIKGTGHFMHRESPEQFNPLMLEWFGQAE